MSNRQRMKEILIETEKIQEKYEDIITEYKIFIKNNDATIDIYFSDTYWDKRNIVWKIKRKRKDKY